MNGLQCSKALLHKYARLLQDCTKSKDLNQGMLLHAHVHELGFDSNVYVGNTLVYMYAKCGCIQHARHLFDNMHEHNLFSWTAIISAYAEHGPAEEAIHLYQRMRELGLLLDKYVFLSTLKACISFRCLVSGMHVHSHIIISGCESDVFVANTLIDMYAKCWYIDHAQQVFRLLLKPDVISWNIIMTGCLYQGLHEEIFTYYRQMQKAGMQPNDVTYMLALKACAGCACLTKCKQVHVQVCESCLKPDLSVFNTLVDMYAKGGDIDSAHTVFNRMSQRDITTWNVMVAAYVEEGRVLEAFTLFMSMKEKGYKPDEITFSIILKPFGHVTTAEHAWYVHLQFMKSGLKLDALTGSTLIDMYMKCGSHSDAWRMFDQMPEKIDGVWHAMIAGCAQSGLTERWFALFEQFLVEGNLPDKITVTSILEACLSLPVPDHGKAIHVYTMEIGLLSDSSVSNAILEVYVNCGHLEHASQALAKLRTHDILSWNTVIVASIQQGLGENALFLFGQMLHERVTPNHITFSSVLKVCATIPALEWGMEIHKLVNMCACESSISVGSALVDMYAKCGTIDDAIQVFNSMEERQVVTWTAIIAGCALQGLCKEALVLFEKMQGEGIKPDTVTFVTVLSACSRAGLLEEGCYYYILLNTSSCEALTPDHVACMVDLLARAGHLHAAKNLIMDTPIASDDVVWMVLLDACRIHGNVDMGRYACNCVLSLDPRCSQAYVVLSNIYALAGMWDEVTKIREEMKNVMIESST
eukprot:c22809_g1_i1 orf=1033-3297(-)